MAALIFHSLVTGLDLSFSACATRKKLAKRWGYAKLPSKLTGFYHSGCHSYNLFREFSQVVRRPVNISRGCGPTSILGCFSEVRFNKSTWSVYSYTHWFAKPILVTNCPVANQGIWSRRVSKISLLAGL
jgi:hypothetical protein